MDSLRQSILKADWAMVRVSQSIKHNGLINVYQYDNDHTHGQYIMTKLNRLEYPMDIPNEYMIGSEIELSTE